MKIYFKSVGLIFLIAAIIGVIGPFMVSDDSYELPLLFVVVVIALGAFAFRYISKLLESKKNE